MLKESNTQRTVTLPKVLVKKIMLEAEANYTTFNAMLKQIVVEYFKKKEILKNE